MDANEALMQVNRKIWSMKDLATKIQADSANDSLRDDYADAAADLVGYFAVLDTLCRNGNLPKIWTAKIN